MSGSRCVWRRWCSGRRRARPPARSPHASLRLGVVDLEARPGPPDPPTPSTPAVLVSLCVVELPLEARPGPVAAHGYRSLALRHPGLAVLLLVAPLMFWAPSGPAAWPGCLVCPWAAARPRAVRAASFARRVGSKPGQAPPPPTAAAAGPSVPPAPSTPVAPSVLCGVGQAPPPPTAAVARPSCALHTGGTCVAWTSPARPCCWSPSPRAVERSLLSPQSISHAIPSQLFQTMNLDCWNCNVFRRC